MKKTAARVAATFILLAASFTAGVCWRDFGSVHSISSLVAAVRLIPIRIDIAREALASEQSDDYSPYETYADVLATLKANYYGKDLDDTQMTYNAIRGMMASLHDRYTRFMDPALYKSTMDDNSGEFVGIGAALGVNAQNQVYVIKVLAGSPALKYHVMAGDIVMKIDGQSALKLSEDAVVRLIRGEPNTKVTLTVLRKGADRPVVLTIPRGMIQQEVVDYAMIDPANKIGYVALQEFNEESDPEIQHALNDLRNQGARGVVLDLRGNPGGLVDAAVRIASRFIPPGPVFWMKDSTSPMQPQITVAGIHQERLPLAVLVNGDSASAAEILSGAIKDSGTGVLVGEKTFGKGVVQTYMPLRDGSAVAITTQHYYTASKHDINHRGIMPDITVTYTDTEQRRLADYARTHPESLYDIADDPQLRRALSEVQSRLGVSGKGPNA